MTVVDEPKATLPMEPAVLPKLKPLASTTSHEMIRPQPCAGTHVWLNRSPMIATAVQAPVARSQPTTVSARTHRSGPGQLSSLLDATSMAKARSPATTAVVTSSTTLTPKPSHSVMLS
jgi:hypothetical protein